MGKSLSGAIVMCLLTASAASADVQLQLHDGRVSIVAKDATVRQILAEWARVGQTKVVNVDRIPGGPLTLELSNMPEAQALDVLLRSVSGYMAAPRGDGGREPFRLRSHHRHADRCRASTRGIGRGARTDVPAAAVHARGATAGR